MTFTQNSGLLSHCSLGVFHWIPSSGFTSCPGWFYFPLSRWNKCLFNRVYRFHSLWSSAP